MQQHSQVTDVQASFGFPWNGMALFLWTHMGLSCRYDELKKGKIKEAKLLSAAFRNHSPKIWLVVWNMAFIFSFHIWDNPSQLTFIFFQRSWNHQPDCKMFFLIATLDYWMVSNNYRPPKIFMLLFLRCVFCSSQKNKHLVEDDSPPKISGVCLRPGYVPTKQQS